MGFFQQLLGQEGGSLIPGIDNPLQGGTILPGLGQLNIYNPNSVVGRAANDLAKDLGTGVEAIAKDPRKLAAVGIMIAFPGAASALGSYLLPAEVAAAYPTMAAIVGQTALNTATNGGDVKGAVTNALIQQGAPQLTKYVADTYATESISKAITNWAAQATTDVGIASVMGKDPASALMFSGAKAATDAVLDYTGVKNTLANLSPAAASATKAAITAKIMNIDPSKAVAQDLMTSAIKSAQGMVDAQWYAKTNKAEPLTEEQLNKLPPSNPDATDFQNKLDLNNATKNIINDASAQKEGWDNSNQKASAAQEGITNPKEYVAKGSFAAGAILGTDVQGKVFGDGKIQLEGEDKPRDPTPDEAKSIQGLFKSYGRETPKLVSDLLSKDKTTAEDPTAKPTAKTEAGLPSVLPSVEDEEQAKRVKEFGKNLTGGGNQNLGEIDPGFSKFYDPDSSSMGAYKYDAKSGTYTHTSDDGSTLTVDGEGKIVGHTEATDTKLPAVEPAKETAKLPATTTPQTTPSKPDTGLPSIVPAVIGAGIIGSTIGSKPGSTTPAAPAAAVTNPNVTLNWNQQEVKRPENGIAYGQKFFDPVFSAAGGGLMALAAGGMTGKFTTLGSYSDGGRLLRGPGDGMSDNIPATIANRQPARLADGEFVVPADVVSHLGNGSTDAGAKVLYAMMDRVRKARTGKAKQGTKILPQKFMPN
jgi:hypothetical protein